jgi:DNA repair protein RecO (recombination protein O)
MSEIENTEAVVLTKINFGDSSNIVSLFTKDTGKISAIVKGGKTSKSGISKLIDPPNHIRIILYNKASREVQLISGAEIISHYPRIKEDYEKLKYSYGVIELVKKILPDNEANQKLFRGIIRVFELMEEGNEPPAVSFGRFFMFFLKESGFEIQLSECASCGKTSDTASYLSYNFEIGILCNNCSDDNFSSFSIDTELFRYLICLKNNVKVQNPGSRIPGLALTFMEKYLKYHVPGFQGIQTFQIFK